MAYARKNKEEWTPEKDHFYPTTPDVIEAFLACEGPYIPSMVWECAAGDGAISEALKSSGIDVVSTDLVDRGYCQSGVDFLMERKLLAPAIITNPPFKLAAAFMSQAIGLGADYIAFFHQTTFINSKGYENACYRRRPARIYALSWRPDYFRIGSPDQRCCFMWTVWDRKCDGETIFRLMQKPQPKVGK